MTPLKITARVSTPIVCLPFEGLPLDGILSYAVAREVMGDAFYDSDPRRDGCIYFELPLLKCDADRERWFWSCSFADFGESAQDIQHWNKRFDVDKAERFADWGKHKPQVNTQKGEFKSYRMPVPTLSVNQVVWYGMGEQTEAQRLLDAMTHIGKKTSQGFGRVRWWKVEEFDEDWSVRRDGQPTRAIPGGSSFLIGMTGIYTMRLTGFRPPYWLPQNQCLCVVPA